MIYSSSTQLEEQQSKEPLIPSLKSERFASNLEYGIMLTVLGVAAFSSVLSLDLS